MGEELREIEKVLGLIKHRLECRTSFREFIKSLDYGWEFSRHHELIIDKLQEVSDGKIKNLAIFMPPGASKSSYCSLLYPAWFMGNNPSKRVLACTHTDDFAKTWGRKVRNICLDEPFRNTFGITLAKDSQAADRWSLEPKKGERGEYNCAGVGGAIAGVRADCLIIDDYIRSVEDADSKTIRDKQWEWYKHDVLTRLKPGASQILLCTRWHPDDLAGRILERDGKDWTVFKLKMEIETDSDSLSDPLGRKVGEFLWPEWYTSEMISRAKSDLRGWTSLYQQEPSILGGGEFRRDWIQHYDTTPNSRSMGKVLLVDPAGGKKKTSDYTSMWVIGLGEDDNYYILDMVRDRLNLTERTNMVFRLHKKWKPSQVRYEKYGLQADIEHIKSEMARIPYSFSIKEVGGMTSKVDRIRQLLPLFQKGRVWLPNSFQYTGTDGITEDLVKVFIDTEYLCFPVSKHDDMLDSLARICEKGSELPWPNAEFAAWGPSEEGWISTRHESFTPTVMSMGF